MTNPFTNPDSFVLPSMNRVRLVDLPGIRVPLAWQNKSGYGLLGARALQDQIRRKTAVLQLNPHSTNLIWELDACFESEDVVVRETAVAIAKEYGQKLGYHQLVLKRGDVVNRVVRPAWQAVHWAYWAQIERIWLGGGLMAGHLGAIAAAEAQTFIRQHGFPQYQVMVSPFATNLPLVGAARIAPVAAQAMLVFDFGQTAIKRGLMHYEAGQLVGIDRLSSLPSHCPHLGFSREPALAEQTLAYILRVVNKTWAEAQATEHPVSHTIVLVLACYLLEGQPRPEDWGCYGRLQQFSPHLQSYLTEQVSAVIGESVQVRLLHDGEAAALPYAGTPNCGVMTCGTALGIGFPPVSEDGLCAIAPIF